MIGLHVALAVLSPRFTYGNDHLTRPTPLLVGLLVAAGVVYLSAVFALKNAPPKRWLMAWMFGVGLVLRVSMLPSTPMLEDDFYRYLWDGAVLANGLNPYACPPSVAIDAAASGDVPGALGELARESGVVVQRVNHPELRTIYPPVAQAFFALAHWLKPWSLLAWRLVLLALDLTVLGLIILLLRRLDLPPMRFALYWWNPLVVKEVFNSAHMDVIALAFILGALVLAVSGREARAMACIALAAGAKIWPVLLAPLLLRPVWRLPRRVVAASVVFSLILFALLVLPVAAGFGDDSGFTEFARRWEMNDALFMALLWGVRRVVDGVGLGVTKMQSGLVARGIVLALLAAAVAWVTVKKVERPMEIPTRALFIIAALFLFSPTQFPWYALWFIPLLAIRPQPSLLLLTVLLPLYYLRFYFNDRDNVALFDSGIVWLEFVPVWCLLLWEWYSARRRRRAPSSEGTAEVCATRPSSS